MCISVGQKSVAIHSPTAAILPMQVNLQACYSSNILDTPKSPSSDAFFSSLYVEVFPSFRRCHRNQPQAQEVAAWHSCKEHICFVR